MCGDRESVPGIDRGDREDQLGELGWFEILGRRLIDLVRDARVCRSTQYAQPLITDARSLTSSRRRGSNEIVRSSVTIARKSSGTCVPISTGGTVVRYALPSPGSSLLRDRSAGRDAGSVARQ